MLNIKRSTRFKKDYKRIVQLPCYDEEAFKKVIETLVEQKPLDPKYYDHPLKGRYAGLTKCRECHVKPDLVLVYKVYKEDLILYLIEMDTHSNAF